RRGDVRADVDRVAAGLGDALAVRRGDEDRGVLGAGRVIRLGYRGAGAREAVRARPAVAVLARAAGDLDRPGDGRADRGGGAVREAGRDQVAADGGSRDRLRIRRSIAVIGGGDADVAAALRDRLAVRIDRDRGAVAARRRIGRVGRLLGAVVIGAALEARPA